jgi:hypothetical protein
MSTSPNVRYECDVPIRLEGLLAFYIRLEVRAQNLREARRELRRLLGIRQFGAIDLFGTHRGRLSRQPGRLPRGTLVRERGVSPSRRTADEAHPFSPSRRLVESSASSGRSPRPQYRLLPSLTSARPRSGLLPLVKI